MHISGEHVQLSAEALLQLIALLLNGDQRLACKYHVAEVQQSGQWYDMTIIIIIIIIITIIIIIIVIKTLSWHYHPSPSWHHHHHPPPPLPTRVLDMLSHVLQLSIVELPILDDLFLQHLVLPHVRTREVQWLQYLAMQAVDASL